LFGLLAVEIAVTMQNQTLKWLISGVCFLIALIFVWRSFYAMRIPEENLAEDDSDSNLQADRPIKGNLTSAEK
jgi:K(+)-stimulated pyrophosphate-energized sodium pump